MTAKSMLTEAEIDGDAVPTPTEIQDTAAANAADAFVLAELTRRHARETQSRAQMALIHWLAGCESRRLPDGREVRVVGWVGETPVRIVVDEAPA